MPLLPNRHAAAIDDVGHDPQNRHAGSAEIKSRGADSTR
jgi:hypothetical protein